MRHVRFRLSAGGREAAIHPMYDLLANAPFVERATALQWNVTEDGLGIFHFVAGEREPFEAAMESIPEVIGYELEPAGDDAFYVYVRDELTDAARQLFAPMTQGGLVVVPPVRYHEDGTVTVSLFGPDAELQAAMEQVPDLATVTVEEVTGLAATTWAAETRVTDRQREAVEAALDLGYYEVPREATHEAVAERLGCAPSTAAEHLRKAESLLLRSVLG